MTPVIVVLGFAAFLFGLMIGSFLNVCIYRLPREESLVFPPSHCPKCYQHIRAEDNIPVISWLLLRGRCRSCGLRISLIYPVIELAMGALFVFFYWRFVLVFMSPIPDYLSRGQLLYFAVLYLAHMGFISALVVATVIDFRFMIIPDEITKPGIAIAMALSLAFPQLHPEITLAGHPHLSSLLASIVGAAVGAGLIYGIGVAGKVVLAKEAMGFGDVKLMALIGAFLGWDLTVFVLFLSAVLGTVYGVVHLAFTGRSKIPYGPFLSTAAIIALLFSPAIREFISNMTATYVSLFSW